MGYTSAIPPCRQAVAVLLVLTIEIEVTVKVLNIVALQNTRSLEGVAGATESLTLPVQQLSGPPGSLRHPDPPHLPQILGQHAELFSIPLANVGSLFDGVDGGSMRTSAVQGGPVLSLISNTDTVMGRPVSSKFSIVKLSESPSLATIRLGESLDPFAFVTATLSTGPNESLFIPVTRLK